MKVLAVHASKPHRMSAMNALAKGLRLNGIDTTLAHDWGAAENFDVLVTWGDLYPADHPRKLILECGYINGNGGDYTENRLRFISASWNKRHGLSDWNWPITVSDDRWNKLGIELKPWRHNGEYVLLLEQHQGDKMAPDVPVFRKWVMDECARRGWKCRVRHHPAYQGNERTLDKDLADASLAITWCSTASVEAVIAGVPTYIIGAGSIADPVTRSTLSMRPYTAERESWAHKLAYRQWNLDELASGEAWDTIWSAGVG